jgi:hypothetical protein
MAVIHVEILKSPVGRWFIHGLSMFIPFYSHNPIIDLSRENGDIMLGNGYTWKRYMERT